jgi:hypothetical protein
MKKILLLVLVALLVGCTKTETQIVRETVVVPQTVVYVYEATEVPQATVAPTLTPTLEPTVDRVALLETQVAVRTCVTVTPTLANTTKATAAPLAKVDDPDPLDTLGVNDWKVTFYEGVTNQMRDWAKNLPPVVLDWGKFPNEDFPKYDFEAKDGVEYGMAESSFCGQDERCDVNVPAMHYRLITGDYSIPGMGECADGDGCAIILINVGSVTAMFRDSSVDYGFTVFGRYWNGDAMPVTLRALASNTAYNMLNVEGGVNRGSNCSSPDGCEGVWITANILSGNKLLMKAETFATLE